MVRNAKNHLNKLWNYPEGADLFSYCEFSLKLGKLKAAFGVYFAIFPNLLSITQDEIGKWSHLQHIQWISPLGG